MRKIADLVNEHMEALTPDYRSLWSGHRGPVCGFLVFWLQIAIEPLALFHHSGFDCTVDSRYLEFKGTLKHFEISVPRHIRVDRVRTTIN